jgi:hypothetical protein
LCCGKLAQSESHIRNLESRAAGVREGHKRRTASDAGASAKVTKTRSHKSARLSVGRSDESIVDQCRNLRGAPLALCLHEKRGDYANSGAR